MRVFLTGATGFIGSTVMHQLQVAGHEVVGLARSNTAAKSLRAASVGVVRGALDDLVTLRSTAAEADGVVHTAFVNPSPTTDYADAAAVDAAAVRALGAGLEGTCKPLVIASATGLVSTPGRAATENDRANWGPRVAGERAADDLLDRGVRVTVVRLPISVHDGASDRRGFVPGLIDVARRTGVSGHIGDGANRWTAVHVDDAARLFRLALDDAPAGQRLHAVAEEVPFRSIAETIGACLDLPTVAIGQDEADAHFGYLARFVAHDNPTSSAATRSRFRWTPEGPGLRADIASGAYFTDVDPRITAR